MRSIGLSARPRGPHNVPPPPTGRVASRFRSPVRGEGTAKQLSGVVALALFSWGCAGQPEPSAPNCLGEGCGQKSSREFAARARSLAREGRTHVAEQLLQAALAEGADPDILLPLLLRVCVAEGRLQRALDYAQTALLQGYESGELHYLIAVIEWALERPRQAIRHAESALSAPRPHLEAWLLLGDLLLKVSGDAALAGRCYRHLLTANDPRQRARAQAGLRAVALRLGESSRVAGGSSDPASSLGASPAADAATPIVLGGAR